MGNDFMGELPGPGEWPLHTTMSGAHVSLRRILWMTDFSSCSESALQYAMAIARHYGAHLCLAHVVRPESFEFVVPEAVNAILEDARRNAEGEMAKLLISGRLRGVSHRVVIGAGLLWPVLEQLVQEHEIDMIVAGTHGRTGFRKLLLGSVAQEIFHKAPCPVLTVGPHVHEGPGDEIKVRRVLFATNFSPAAESSARYALSLAEENHASLAFLHVVEEGDELPAERQSKVAESVGQQLRELVPPPDARLIEPEVMVEFGQPAETILKVADEMRADLIVLGIRRPSHLFGHPGPDTAYKVVCGASCPVLTVPGKPEVHT
jgi:nucleotide-binding universal stress UspA family protein